MKIVIFEPHPDDLLFGPGPILVEWINEKKHDIHVITITDGRACFRVGEQADSENAPLMSEDEVATMRTKEAMEAIKFIGVPMENHHLFNFHDADGQKNVKAGIEKTIPLIKNADRIVFPSNNNSHVDHQATHDIAIGASKSLALKYLEYFVYFIPSYGKFQEDSKDHQFEYIIDEERAKNLQEWLEIYKSQSFTKYTWKMYTRFLQKIRKWIYSIYKFEEIGKYYNF
ncbi:MAG: PIG-L family deacetylase [Candidatus Lokiarchaeota archaeon]|nr:PIG-L family deacetylase [Candidatus Lokiarchaeota archaeon]